MQALMTRVKVWTVTLLVLAVAVVLVSGMNDDDPDYDIGPDDRVVTVHFTAKHLDPKKIGYFDVTGLMAGGDLDRDRLPDGYIHSEASIVGAHYIFEMWPSPGVGKLSYLGCRIRSNNVDITRVDFREPDMSYAKCTGIVPR